MAEKKLLDPQTSFLESDFDIGESSVMCKVRLSASERCNTRLGVCLDGEGRWKISNFTKHVLHKHMKNSTKSGLNKSGLKDDEKGASPASSDTDSDCEAIDSHYSNDDSTSQDTLNRKEQSSRQSSQSGLSTTERIPFEILLDDVQAKEGTTSSRECPYS